MLDFEEFEQSIGLFFFFFLSFRVVKMLLLFETACGFALFEVLRVESIFSDVEVITLIILLVSFVVTFVCVSFCLYSKYVKFVLVEFG